jgi:hypothetical protein
MPSLDHVEQFCDVCVLTKQSRLPFPHKSSFQAKERLKLVHGDLCGPVTPVTPGGRRYFLLPVDDLSRYMWVVVLGSKGDAANTIKRAHAAAEVECGRVLRTDNDDKFIAAEFASYCAVQPDGCEDGSGPSQAEGNVGCLLRRCGDDGCLHPQPLAHQGSQQQDVVRGLAWAQVSDLSPTSLRLPHIHQEAWSHRQA